MRASIRQVAETANVSPMTVTRVLRGRGLVSEETRQRVLAAVRETNYIPVRSSVQNRHSPTRILGLVPYQQDVMQNRLDSETYAGIFRAARTHGYDLLVMLRGESEWMVDQAAARFLDRRSDGFIFNSAGTGEWHEVLPILAGQKIPVVVCYRRDVPSGIAWVDPDNDHIIELAVHALLRQGHQRIGYLPGYSMGNADTEFLPHPRTDGNFDDSMRRAAFERKVRETGCEGRILETPYLDDILTQKITGVVCVNDYQALLLWDQAVAQGMQIPRDLSLVGVDDIPDAQTRGMTSIGFGYDAVGATAVEVWLDLLQGKSARESCRVVPATLRERQSIAPPRH